MPSGSSMFGWTVDEDGYLRTPSGMKAGRLTPECELEIADKVEHRPVKIPMLALMQMWLDWTAKRTK